MSVTRISGRVPYRLRVAVLGIAAGLLLLSATSAQAGPCANTGLVSRAGTAFIKAAKSRSSAAFARALRSYTDLRRISLYALGKHRKSLPRGQRNRFVRLTGAYLARKLAGYSGRFQATSLQIVRCRGAVVETRLLQSGGRPARKVSWRIARGRVADVKVQNIWLAQLLRSNYASIIRKGDGDIGVLLAVLAGGRGRVVTSNR